MARMLMGDDETLTMRKKLGAVASRSPKGPRPCPAAVAAPFRARRRDLSRRHEGRGQQIPWKLLDQLAQRLHAGVFIKVAGSFGFHQSSSHGAEIGPLCGQHL
ncbi:MAG TPA: hypothetical protein PLW65_02075 [Pseudomonadota bacterium]|nr:hypothetical protein [Pseudomonadota bacterium]